MAVKKIVASFKKDFDMNSIPSCKFYHSQWEQCVEDADHPSIVYLVYRIVFMVILVSSLTFSTLCQSYLFEIFLTNWNFTIQTLYAILFSFNILWRTRGSLKQFLCVKSHHHVHPAKSSERYELQETRSWHDAAALDIDSTAVKQDINNGMTCGTVGNCASENLQEQRQLNLASTEVLTTDTLRNSETSVIISNNNNYKDSSRNDAPPSLLEKTIWALMNVSHVLPHVVTFGYWIFVYKYDPEQKSCERFRSHFIVHAATAVLAFIDSMVVAIPARKSHFVFPSFVLLVYGLFSCVYEFAGGEYRNGKEFIYSFLNWRYNPGKTTLVIIFGFIISPLGHFFGCWCLHAFKLWTSTRYLQRRNKK